MMFMESPTVLATFGVGQVLWAFLVFFFWIIWFYLLIIVFGDIFRSRDLSGAGKAVWALFVVLLPYLGVFVYLLIRGGEMHERAAAAAQAQDAAFRQYVQDAAATGGGAQGAADELARLDNLKQRGVISEEEFQRLKAKVDS